MIKQNLHIRDHRLCLLLLSLVALSVLTFPNAAQARYSRENAVVRAVRKVSPAVVNISTETLVRERSPFFSHDPFFDSFFRDFFESRRERPRYQRSSLGSGIIIDGRRGFVLTNAHVIGKAGKITAILKDEREFEASVVGADPIRIWRSSASDLTSPCPL